MDVARLEELRHDLLHGEILKHRRLLGIVGLCMLAFWTVAIIGGYALITHAMDDNQMTSRHPVDTPSQIPLLFAGHRPYDLINDLVYLNRVKLSPTSAGHVYYATDDNGNRLLVVAHTSKAPSDDAVAGVKGTLRPITSELLKKWKVSKDDQKALKAQGIYLDAESVKPQKNPSTLASK